MSTQPGGNPLALPPSKRNHHNSPARERDWAGPAAEPGLSLAAGCC